MTTGKAEYIAGIVLMLLFPLSVFLLDVFAFSLAIVIIFVLVVFTLPVGIGLFIWGFQKRRETFELERKTTKPTGTAAPNPTSRGGPSEAVAVVVVCVIIFAGLSILLFADTGSGGCCPLSKSPSLGMAAGASTSTACGTTPGALYIESVAITSTSSTITTNMLGLKVVPTVGGLPVKNVAPPASESPCPTTGGFYVSLNNSAGTAVACWAGVIVTGAPVWSSPTSGVCTNPNGGPLGSPITIMGGQTFVVYMYGSTYPGVPPMAGAYSLQPYGVNFGGSVEL
jgi:hypothetical protein